MKRFFLEIAFDGTDFHGWQIQPHHHSVQAEMEQVLSQVLQEKISVVGCGRTDAGVHAHQFYMHFDCNIQPYHNLVYKLNSLLPQSIAVKRIIPVGPDSHARYDATKRTYLYKIHFEKDPFLANTSYFCFYKNLNIDKMREVIDLLPDIKDFAPLSKSNEDDQSTICDIYHSELVISPDEKEMELIISANRFLHNMIRRIVGLLIVVGREKISIQEVRDVLSAGGNFRINFVAPPQGLSLTGVEYPYINERK